jgi:hypothetical protein
MPAAPPLDGAQILSGRLAGPAVCDDVEGNLLTLAKAVHASTFDRADMNEDIFAVLRLNEAEAFLAVKPLYSSVFMGDLPLVRVYISRTISRPVHSRFL